MKAVREPLELLSVNRAAYGKELVVRFNRPPTTKELATVSAAVRKYFQQKPRKIDADGTQAQSEKDS